MNKEWGANNFRFSKANKQIRVAGVGTPPPELPWKPGGYLRPVPK
jgi:hypothetical protein